MILGELSKSGIFNFYHYLDCLIRLVIEMKFIPYPPNPPKPNPKSPNHKRMKQNMIH